ncbi:MAG: hypothetical protein Q4F17_00925 [Eubacteriales bacterium]|nr:hypothetical protein [Eubacteriales bacterium]
MIATGNHGVFFNPLRGAPRTDAFPSLDPRDQVKGGGGMVTYENLFAFASVLIEAMTLAVLFYKHRK